MLAARRKDRLEKLKKDLESQHPQINIRTFELDVRNRAKVQATAATFGDIDVLVNNAGKELSTWRFRVFAFFMQSLVSIYVCPCVFVCFAVSIAYSNVTPPSLWYTGLVIGLEKLEDITEEAMDTMIDTNVKGLVHVTQAVLPGMRARDKGHIINIGSVAGQQAYGNGSIYCGSKAAVASISKALLFETIDTAIRISEINPGKSVLICIRLNGCLY